MSILVSSIHLMSLILTFGLGLDSQGFLEIVLGKNPESYNYKARVKCIYVNVLIFVLYKCKKLYKTRPPSIY